MTRGAERGEQIKAERISPNYGPRENVVDVFGLNNSALEFASFAERGAG